MVRRTSNKQIRKCRVYLSLSITRCRLCPQCTASNQGPDQIAVAKAVWPGILASFEILLDTKCSKGQSSKENTSIIESLIMKLWNYCHNLPIPWYYLTSVLQRKLSGSWCYRTWCPACVYCACLLVLYCVRCPSSPVLVHLCIISSVVETMFSTCSTRV